jgi:hypothetical protein
MLYEQLIQAIGHEFNTQKFAEFMDVFQKRIFKPIYSPRAFSISVRMPERYPQGNVEIIDQNDRPILTNSRKLEGKVAFKMDINAATTIVLSLDLHIHSWVSHSFAGEAELDLTLVARARQFSSFILLVGKILDNSTFEPTAAIMVQNKVKCH